MMVAAGAVDVLGSGGGRMMVAGGGCGCVGVRRRKDDGSRRGLWMCWGQEEEG